jgi:hypothetical protein
VILCFHFDEPRVQARYQKSRQMVKPRKRAAPTAVEVDELWHCSVRQPVSDGKGPDNHIGPRRATWRNEVIGELGCIGTERGPEWGGRLRVDGNSCTDEIGKRLCVVRG